MPRDAKIQHPRKTAARKDQAGSENQKSAVSTNTRKPRRNQPEGGEVGSEERSRRAGAARGRGAGSRRNGVTVISQEGSLTSQAVGLTGYSKQNLFKTHQAFCLVLFPCPERAGAKGFGNHSSIRTLHEPQG